jgi:hypothetical protein
LQQELVQRQLQLGVIMQQQAPALEFRPQLKLAVQCKPGLQGAALQQAPHSGGQQVRRQPKQRLPCAAWHWVV